MYAMETLCGPQSLKYLLYGLFLFWCVCMCGAGD
jgi:hypothetical protein